MGRADYKGDVEYRRLSVAKLYASGMSGAQIARRLKVAEHLVGADLANIKSDWSRRKFQDVDAVLGAELGKLDIVEQAMMARLLKQDGFGIDVRAAAVLVKLMERRAKLIGLDAPKTVDITGLLESMALAAGVSMELMQTAAHEIVEKKKMLEGSWNPASEVWAAEPAEVLSRNDE